MVVHRPPPGQLVEPPVDDFWPDPAELGLADPDPDPESDEDFVADAGVDSVEEEEEEDPESGPPAGTVADEPDRLSVR